MWRPEINSLVRIRHPEPAIANMLATLAKRTQQPEKVFRIESLVDYPDGSIEAILQPEHSQYPPDTTHTIYTSWLIPA